MQPSTVIPPPALPLVQARPRATAAENIPESSEGCLVSTSFSNVACVEKILAFFRHACNEGKFTSSIANCGFDGPRFSFNQEFMTKGNPGFDKFVKGIQNRNDGDGDPKLAVVFHGTGSGNVEIILRNGLDPSLRKGQAYGPGEYFGKDPGVSVGYCKGGKQIIVFVVILPEKISKWIPPNIVVVENNEHQLPLGTLHFDSVDGMVLRHSQAQRTKFRVLSRAAWKTSQVAECAKLKAKIMQRLIAGDIVLASEAWEKNRDYLDETTKHEISWYAHQQLDADVLPVLFPKLPEPLSPGELEKINVTSVEDAQQKEDVARKQVEDAQKALFQPQVLPPHNHQSVQAGARTTSFGMKQQQNFHYGQLSTQNKVEKLKRRRLLRAQRQQEVLVSSVAASGSGQSTQQQSTVQPCDKHYIPKFIE